MPFLNTKNYIKISFDIHNGNKASFFENYKFIQKVHFHLGVYFHRQSHLKLKSDMHGLWIL